MINNMNILNKLYKLNDWLKNNLAPSTDMQDSKFTETATHRDAIMENTAPSVKTVVIEAPKFKVTEIQSYIHKKTIINVSINGNAIRGEKTYSTVSQTQIGILKKDGYWYTRIEAVEIRWREGEYRYFEVKNEPSWFRTRVGACGDYSKGWFRIHQSSMEIKRFYQVVELVRTGLSGKIEHK